MNTAPHYTLSKHVCYISCSACKSCSCISFADHFSAAHVFHPLTLHFGMLVSQSQHRSAFTPSTPPSPPSPSIAHINMHCPCFLSRVCFSLTHLCPLYFYTAKNNCAKQIFHYLPNINGPYIYYLNESRLYYIKYLHLMSTQYSQPTSIIQYSSKYNSIFNKAKIYDGNWFNSSGFENEKSLFLDSFVKLCLTCKCARLFAN